MVVHCESTRPLPNLFGKFLARVIICTRFYDDCHIPTTVLFYPNLEQKTKLKTLSEN